MANNWLEIWNKRDDKLDCINKKDYKRYFAELKRINGFDITDGGIPISALIAQYEDTKKYLHLRTGDSVFEVGCGCGANLYMFLRDNIYIGGVDYSEKLISILHKVFPDNELREGYCAEAINITTDIVYDSVLSNSVFSYFPDFMYAENVLNKMLCKTKRSIGILDIHDIEKKDDFINYRIKNTENYLERYKKLPKLFYPRSFFERFAEKNGLKVIFVPSTVEGYWNNEFIFNCFMYI